MSVVGDPAHQALARPLTDLEQKLADALVRTFGGAIHDFEEVAKALTAAGVARPSGDEGPWSAQVLDAELKRINLSLDASYEQLSAGKDA